MSSSRLIPNDRIIKRLQVENPWWTTRETLEIYRSMSKRLYFSLFYPFVKDQRIRRAVVLMGPRRVGKTIMLFHAIQHLLEDGVHPHRILFAGIDNPIYINLSLEDVLHLFMESLHKKDLRGCYVFFDEIQYLKDWEHHLKVLVDTFPETKFVVSGSAAAALKWYSTESGAGRFTDFTLPPLTFQEFMHLKNKNHLVQPGQIQYGDIAVPYLLPIHIDELNTEFIEYLNFGGYPEVVFSDAIQNDMGRYIKNDIIDKVLLRDLPSLYGISDIQGLNRFFTYLAFNTGKAFSYESMSKESGIPKDMLKKYLEYLEAAFLIKVFHKLDFNAKNYRRVTRFKVYLTNCSLRTALFSPVRATDDEMGMLVETAVLSQWMHRNNPNLYYAFWNQGNRKQSEVDMVHLDDKSFNPRWAVEIKWSNRYFDKPGELKSLIQFCNINGLSKAIVTTIDKYGKKAVGDVQLTFIPAAVYVYNVGHYTMKLKESE